MARSSKQLAFKQRNSELRIRIAKSAPPELVEAVSRAKNQVLSKTSAALRRRISATRQTDDVKVLLDAIYSYVDKKLVDRYHIQFMPNVNISASSIAIVWERTPEVTLNKGRHFHSGKATVDRFVPAYSAHAVLRCIERTTAPMPFTGLWDAYVRLFAASREITHEPWLAESGKLLGFSVWEACHASGIGIKTAELLGFDPRTSKRVVGYCPAKMHPPYLSAATFLSPGYDGTPQELQRRDMTTATYQKHGESSYLNGIRRLHLAHPIVKAS